jgi:glycerophosphoryl diester phosphodiesterase
LVVASKWESFKSIVAFNLSQRNTYSRLAKSHIRIYTYTIDDPDQMDWLLEAGVDGIITNKPGLLSHRISLKYNRLRSF